MAPQRSLHPRHVCGKIVSETPVAQIPAPRWNLQPSVGTWSEAQCVLINLVKLYDLTPKGSVLEGNSPYFREV